MLTDFTPTPTGVSVRFNQPVDPSVLSLYDAETGGLGPADVTVVGQGTGPARGSLVLDAAGQTLTFLHTKGLLPPDTYTVTLRSAADGFRTPAGDLLDGNGDGTPGDAFGSTFTVAPSSARSLSVPDLVRGPGQPLDAGLPLTLSDGTGITQVGFTLAYDPALLAITGVTPGAALPEDTQVTTDFSDPGLVQIEITSPTSLPAGPLELVRLQGEIPHTAP